MASLGSIHIRDAMKDRPIVLTVKIRGTRQLSIKLTIAKCLIRFAMWLIYGRAEFVEDTPHEESWGSGGYQPTDRPPAETSETGAPGDE